MSPILATWALRRPPRLRLVPLAVHHDPHAGGGQRLRPGPGLGLGPPLLPREGGGGGAVWGRRGRPRAAVGGQAAEGRGPLPEGGAHLPHRQNGRGEGENVGESPQAAGDISGSAVQAALTEVSADNPETTMGTPVSKGVGLAKTWGEGRLIRTEEDKDKPELVVFSQPAGAPFPIGRGSSCELTLAGITGISVQHCSLRLEDGEPLLSDTSLNGTYVNGALVGKGNERVLPTGAVITFIKNKPYPQMVFIAK
ncbi:unnamed protein product [Effrenium voratum]|nr:unnamed protein product [Effrenium voratum]